MRLSKSLLWKVGTLRFQKEFQVSNAPRAGLLTIKRNFGGEKGADIENCERIPHEEATSSTKASQNQS